MICWAWLQSRFGRLRVTREFFKVQITSAASIIQLVARLDRTIKEQVKRELGGAGFSMQQLWHQLQEDRETPVAAF